MIDLHVHSTFSDGSLTPEELVAAGKAAGLSALALTDHDSTGGMDRFLKACDGAGIRGVPGVEISVEVEKGTLHVLGYYFDTGDERLQAVLREIRDGRELRNERILAKLQKLGMALSWDEVAAHAGEEVVGRPHFARAMIARGFVRDNKDAFDRFLAKGKAAYVDRFRLSAKDSIKVIVDAGGVAVMAHPFTLGLGRAALKTYVGELVEVGLKGIEVYYSEHGPAVVREYEALAAAHGLVTTGGSDFHGEINPQIRLGRGFGNLSVPDELVDALEGAAGCRAATPAAGG